MDINYLLHRHQVSVMRAGAATCRPSRMAHEGLASLYASAVSRLQVGMGGGGRLIHAFAGEAVGE